MENAAGDPPPSFTREQLLAAGWQPLETPGFVDIVGPVFFREADGGVRYGFVAEPRHRNRRSVIHGGVLAAFSDRALAMAGRRVNDSGPQATIELSIRFIDAVQIGDFVECAPEVVRKTRSVIFVRGTLFVGERIVATTDGIWKLLAPPKAS